MRLAARLIAVMSAAGLLAGCDRGQIPPPEPPPAERVFVMYDNIDNDYRKPFTTNVDAAGRAVASGALGADERVVVFHRGVQIEGYTGARSVIYELVKDASQGAGFRREMLRVYGQNENADLSPGVIAAVVGDIRGAVPASHYGLAFGSHGKGWIPKSSTVTVSRAGKVSAVGPERPFAELWAESENDLTRFFAGYGDELDVSEFIDGLDEWSWDFILLDDCFMASVETLYEMRTLADYFIASPTEIMMAGFPYDEVVSILFADWERDLESSLADVADAFVEAYWSEDMEPGYPYATVAVVKAAEMDALAESVRRLNLTHNEVTSTNGIQYYERYTDPGHVFYDLDDYIGHIRATATPTDYNDFKARLDRAVIFKDHTGYFFSNAQLNAGTVRVDHFSGLAVFIPWSQTAPLLPEYQQTEWYKYVYGGN